MILNRQTMTSLEIAELTGREHKNVMQSIRAMEPAWERVHGLKFQLMQRTVETNNGGHRLQPYYELTKTECLYVATKFNDEARAKLVLRWEELENQSQYQVPQTFADALMLAATQAKHIEEQKKAIRQSAQEIAALSFKLSEMQPKVSYVDMVLQCKETVTTTQIAQDYGMSAKAFNVLLRNFGIQHKVGGQWILYAKYLQQGYVQSDTIGITHTDGTKGVVMHTKWTQKGRLFVYEELKKKEILPLIEK